jgi:cell division protein FtsL
MMESLKRPEMIVSVTTAAGLIGTIIYFYKRENSLQEEINELSGHLASTAKRVADMQNNGGHIQQLVNALNQLNARLKKQQQEITSLKEQVQDLTRLTEEQNSEILTNREMIQVINKSLKDIGVAIDLSSINSRQAFTKPLRLNRRKSQKKSTSDENEINDDDNDDDNISLDDDKTNDDDDTAIEVDDEIDKDVEFIRQQKKKSTNTLQGKSQGKPISKIVSQQNRNASGRKK